jgi:pantothenate kinase
MATVHLGFDDLLDRARQLAVPGRRHILGITGAPGAGKSWLAEKLAHALGAARAAVVSMDGFHLANRVLTDLGIRDRKGAIDTFDAAGYAELLERLHSQRAGGGPARTAGLPAPAVRHDRRAGPGLGGGDG